MSTSKKIQVALVGNPNVGKTSVFNRLTGLNQHVGNYPGITVDKKEGVFALPDGRAVHLLDLPGTYSLHPNSPDERIILDVLARPGHPLYPELVLYLAEASSLERHLLLLTQIMDLGLPVVLVLTMPDLAAQAGLRCDEKLLAKLLGVPVVTVNGRTGEGMAALKAAIAQPPAPAPAFYDAQALAPALVGQVQSHLGAANPYQAWLLAHHGADLNSLPAADKAQLAVALADQPLKRTRLQVTETLGRYDKIAPLVQRVLHPEPRPGQTDLTSRLDRVLTHPVYGLLIFFGLLFLIFQAIFAWATYPMDLIDGGFKDLAAWLKDRLPNHWLTGLLADGLVGGLGGVLVFVPQITLLTTFIVLLEEVGYMARAVFLTDGLMRRFGLNGRSIVALFSGAACAIPAIMSTRTITNWRERLITILVTPFISCSARIPVFAILVAFVVPREQTVWLFNAQGVVVMGLYLLGVVAALGSAYVLKKILKSTSPSYLLMELPPYRPPQWRNLGLAVWEKVSGFVVEAGRVIVAIAVILWALASFGPGQQMAQAEAETRASQAHLPPAELDNLVAARRIEVSYAGHLGKLIEPTIAPLGFDWKIGIALISSFAAREVFVGTLATIYNLGSSEDAESISAQMRQQKRPDGTPLYSQATALSLLVFYLFAMQCMSTLAVVRRETKSWKWPLVQLAYMTAVAYLSSLAVYQTLAG
ncbi:MAG: ferrous iron transport protein B [Bernardetiaceae bacterium]|jgi:ferrous iron transport protein B|nr:ferrous iron transport protein B [Bernardetiaceae bacterium]